VEIILLTPPGELCTVIRSSKGDSLMEVREKYYEVYIDGDLHHKGFFEDCRYYALYALDDDCAEVYEVTVTEEKVVI